MVIPSILSARYKSKLLLLFKSRDKIAKDAVDIRFGRFAESGQHCFEATASLLPGSLGINLPSATFSPTAAALSSPADPLGVSRQTARLGGPARTNEACSHPPATTADIPDRTGLAVLLANSQGHS